MPRLALSLLLGLAVATPVPAIGADWSLSGRISEELSLASNPGLDPDPGGVRFGSRSTLSLGLGARTRRTVWSLDTQSNLTLFTGGDEDDGGSDLNGLRPNLSGRVSHERQRVSVSGFGNLRIRSTAARDFFVPLDELSDDPIDTPTDITDDFVRVERDTDRINFGGGSRVEFALTPLTSLSLGLSASAQRYAESLPGLSTSTNFGGDISVSTRIDRVSSIGATVSVLRFRSEEIGAPDNQDGVNVSASGNYATQLSPQTNISGRLGVSYTDSTEETRVLGLLIRDDERNIGVTGGLSVRTELRRSAFSASLSQDVRPSSFGETRNVTSVRASYERALSRRLDLSLTGRYSLQSDLDESGDLEHFFEFSPSLAYALSRNWSAGLSYRLRGSDDEAGVAIDNEVSLRLSRGFDLLR